MGGLLAAASGARVAREVPASEAPALLVARHLRRAAGRLTKLRLPENEWRDLDALVRRELHRAEERLPLLVDQGEDDQFFAEQLQSERLTAACDAAGHPCNVRMQPGYDHSYYFVSTFIGDHVAHHAEALRG